MVDEIRIGHSHPLFFGSSHITGEGTKNKNDGTTANSQQETPNFQVTANGAGAGNGLTTLPFLYPRVSASIGGYLFDFAQELFTVYRKSCSDLEIEESSNWVYPSDRRWMLEL
jgi:hypothetical protein